MHGEEKDEGDLVMGGLDKWKRRKGRVGNQKEWVNKWEKGKREAQCSCRDGKWEKGEETCMASKHVGGVGSIPWV